MAAWNGRNHPHRCQRDYFWIDRVFNVSGLFSAGLESSDDFGGYFSFIRWCVVFAIDLHSGHQLERPSVWLHIRSCSCLVGSVIGLWWYCEYDLWPMLPSASVF